MTSDRPTHESSDDLLSEIVNLTRTLPEVEDLPASLSQVAAVALSMVPGQGASVRVFNEDRKALIAAGRTGERVHDSPTVEMPVDKGVIGWVAKNGRAALVTDADTDPRFDQRPDQIRHIRSLVCVPIFVGRDVIGVVGVTHTEPDQFSRDHINLLQIVANCASPSIAMGRLKALSLSDNATLTFNRRFFESCLAKEIERAQADDGSLAVIRFNIPRYTPICEEYGQQSGEEMLLFVCDRIRELIRRHDVLCRLENGDFAIIMPETDFETANDVAQWISSEISQTRIPIKRESVFATINIGAVSVDLSTDTVDTVLQRTQAVSTD